MSDLDGIFQVAAVFLKQDFLLLVVTIAGEADNFYSRGFNFPHSFYLLI